MRLLRIIPVLFIIAAILETASGLDEPQKYFSRWPAGLPADSSFFPIAVWLQSPSNAAAYKAAGVNLYVGLWQGPTSAQLTALNTAGMKVICDQNNTGLTDAHKNVIVGWMHGDEPDNAQSDGQGGYGPCIPPDTLLKNYQAWRAADSSRPVYLNLGQGVSYISYIGRGSACSGRTDMYPQYIRATDIVSYDIYPVNSTYPATKGNLWYVPKGVDSLRMWGNNAKPVFCWIECTLIDSGGVAPTTAQIKSEVWMALIHGANGFGYFCHSFYPTFVEAGWLNNAPVKAAITAVNQRVQSLAAVLNSPGRNSLLSLQTSRVAVPIDASVKTFSGATYLLSCAMRNDTATGTFTLSGFPGVQNVEVTDESRTLTMTNGIFRDNFTGYAVHLYKIAALPVSRELKSPVPSQALNVFPQPFRDEVVIAFDNAAAAGNGITVFSPSGRMVRFLKASSQVRWDGRDDAGKPLPAGIYVLKTGSGKGCAQRTIVLMR